MEISGTNVPVTFHLEGKPLTSHDCTVIWHLLKRINTFSVQTALHECFCSINSFSYSANTSDCEEILKYFREKCGVAV